MLRRALAMTVLLAASPLLLGACSGASTPPSAAAPATGTPATSPTPAPATGTPAASSTPQPSGTPSGSPAAFNACSLLTDSEALALTTVLGGPGFPSTLNGAFVCEWGPTAWLSVHLEPDAATAKADYSASVASAPRVYPVVEPLPNFADGAFIGRNDNAYHSGAIDVLAGTAFFEIKYQWLRTIPSDAQLKNAATLVKGRLP